MFGPPPSTEIAGIDALVVAAAFVGFGYLLADALADRAFAKLPLAARWGLAVPAVALYTIALMLVHIASGGRLLSNPWLTRGVTAAVALALLVRKGSRLRRRAGGADPGRSAERRGMWAAAAMAIVGVVVWGIAVFQLLPLNAYGDIPGHVGWAMQILDGETTPSASVTGYVPNYYPWLYHAMLALLAQFSMGGRAYDALGPLQFLLVSGTILALFGIGMSFTGRWLTGAGAALFGGIAGGLGFVRLHHIDLVVNPRGHGGQNALKYLGDLLFLRSYNVSFAQLAPPFPRDVALLLLIGFMLLLVYALRHRSTSMLIGAGALAGASGLAGGESFITAMGIAAVVWLLPPAGLRRRRVFLALLVPAVAVYCIWLVPTFVSYLRYHGFANITRVGPVVLTPVAILVGWGLATPFGAYGFARWFPRIRRDPALRVIVMLMAVTAFILIIAGFVPKTGPFRGFMTLTRQHRYWPLFELGIALWAAIGLSDLLVWLWRSRWAAVTRGIAVITAIVVLGLALPSPTVGTLALAKKFGTGTHSVLGKSLRGQADTVLSLVSPRPGWRCIAAVPLPLQPYVFSYTGYRLVEERHANYSTNQARIRWKDIYRYIPGDLARDRANGILTTGAGTASRFRALVRQYGVDVIVAPAADARSRNFAGYRIEPAKPFRQVSYVVVWLHACA